MKLLFVTGSRGEWGYIRPVLELCQARGVDYSICATNMLLLPTYGSLVDEIAGDGFEISDRIYMSLEGNNHFTMVKSLGVFLMSFSDVLVRQRPTWVVLAGDRGEQLMSAVAGAYSYVPTAHIQAGERSGNIDGVARHALGKLAHLHFAANDDAAQRLLRLGEASFRVHNVGAPQLDELSQGRYSSLPELEKRYGVSLTRPYLMVVQHPVTEDFGHVEDHAKSLSAALSRFDMPKIVILPNNDAGSDRVRRALLRERAGEMHVFANLTRGDYLGFLRSAACLIGNSSSGLLEAPTFELPAVNIGRRQADRVQAANVINADFTADDIAGAIERALAPTFRQSLQGLQNPYGDGRSAERILDVLSTMPRDDKLLVKRLTY